MKTILIHLPMQRMFLMTILLIALGLFVTNYTVKADESWSCPPPAPSGCTIEGCHNSLPQGGGYMVCTYFGQNCPPLTQCEGGPSEGN
jgi:hypothetical protein